MPGDSSARSTGEQRHGEQADDECGSEESIQLRIPRVTESAVCGEYRLNYVMRNGDSLNGAWSQLDRTTEWS